MSHKGIRRPAQNSGSGRMGLMTNKHEYQNQKGVSSRLSYYDIRIVRGMIQLSCIH